jgi:CBS domain containing-hemolysin-like protein
MLCPEYSVVLRPIYSGDLRFQITFKRGFRDSNPGPQSRSRHLNAVQRDDGSWLIAGSMPVDEMADRLSIALPQERNYHTAAGFALDQLGYLPAIGESFNHQGWRFEVIDLDGRRIDKILARRIGAGRRRAAV